MNKKINILVFLITLLFLSLLTFNQIIMRSIKTEIVINVPVEEVWKIIMNHELYPEWNPFINKISGKTEPGEHLQVTIQSEGNKPMDFKPLVLINDTNREFRWVGKLGVKGIFDGEHYFILEQTGPNQTKFIHGENFKGILSGLLLKMIGKDTENGFRAMNKALKVRAENN